VYFLCGPALCCTVPHLLGGGAMLDVVQLSVVESSDDDRSEPVVAKKARTLLCLGLSAARLTSMAPPQSHIPQALGRKAKARERRKQRKLAKKQKKASRAEPEAPPGGSCGVPT